MGKRLLGFTVLLLLVSIPLFSQDTIPQTALDPIVDASTLNDVAPKDQIVPNQGFSFSSLWRGMLGMLVLIAISYLFSSNRRAINWRTVGLGLSAQFLLAIGVLKIPFIRTFFTIMGKAFNKVLTFTEAGTKFLFSSFTTNEIEEPLVTFAIMILPTIIFFSALTSVLFYLGIIQKVVKGLAWALTKLLKISGAESLSVAGNIFLGQTESPLMIKAYLEKMNKSEILLVMIGGMATVAGGVLAAYIGFLGGTDEALRLEFARHLLAASVMAAPGAVVISKILVPQTEAIDENITVSKQKIGSNLLDAMATGTTEGLKLAANVAAMLLVFVAFIAMINYGFLKLGSIGNLNGWIATNTPYAALSLELILGYIFAPLMWLIGVAKEDITLMGQLLGIKLAASEFVGYIQLAELKNVDSALHFKYNKSIIMATYMLCGFANFASIGIQIGGIGSLAPGQRKNLSRFGMKALLGGTIASLLSATIAGMILG
ncbi:MAG: Na+ dependent nucleoside transporter [Muricauda sp.]|nr:nucleoside transporter C-terminal domain-containing protein [Allomuricauda sp.]MAU27137.1 Na+ dependent nucleoside transporter [Allomuricauda sp.]MBC32009.1 Na+ dependent nucleoside transporter [Allomuricauda sp.]|tara:strand:+ start:30394 stop:31854 length:1461 start_codon:yes stop_codon:yes gene_type:complete